MERYHQALRKEIELFMDSHQAKITLDSLFIGGGTPSTYPDNLLLDTSDTLRKMVIFRDTSEVTIEVNPGTVKKEQCTTWRNAGINRVSIGVQSLNDTVLRRLNRKQTAQDVYSLLEYVPDYFENISVDIILGLPGVTHHEWKQLVRELVTWPIKHVSVYFLTIHENTQLYFKVKANRVRLPSDASMINLYEWTVDCLQEHGFEQYELSNFARPGYESIHNSAYWDRKPYKGFGLGACSFDGATRFQNEKSLLPYIEGVEQGKDVTTFWESITPEQVHLEKLMLGLRRRSGISWESVLEDLSEEKQNQFKERVAQLKQKKLMRECDGALLLTRAGLVVENEILSLLSR